MSKEYPSVDYGNGVYYFPLIGNISGEAVFGEILSAFITKHPKLQPVAMSSFNTLAWGTVGYFVVFKEEK